MTKYKAIFAFCLLTIIISCGPHISYIGESHPSTSEVDIYYDERKIADEYEIMGHAVGDGKNIDDIKVELIARAKLEGADAILVKDLGKEKYAINNDGGVGSSNLVSVYFIKF